jgi:hypothetical protein
LMSTGRTNSIGGSGGGGGNALSGRCH